MIRVFASPLEAAYACASQVLEILTEVTKGGRDATVAVSGGSTPKLMFEALAASRFDWSRVHLFWVDERCVPPTDEQSNYKLAKECFIDPAGMRTFIGSSASTILWLRRRNTAIRCGCILPGRQCSM